MHASLEKAAHDLLELKKIKNRIESGCAQPGEVEYYEQHKAKAWKALEQSLDYGDAYGYRLPSSLEHQHGGQHYKGRGIQPVEYAAANNMSFNLGSVLKYITRYREKDGLDALKKALHFLQFEIEQVYRVRSKVEYDTGNIGDRHFFADGKTPFVIDEKIVGHEQPVRTTGSFSGGIPWPTRDEHCDAFNRGGHDAPRR